jgi:hypothetical protein
MAVTLSIEMKNEGIKKLRNEFGLLSRSIDFHSFIF